MKPLLRTLTILASLCLVAQTIRHAYVLWLQPRASVLDRYDKPLGKEIDSAVSIEELVRRYDPVRKEADRIKADRRAADPQAEFHDESEAEPFKSESDLREAIVKWEERAKEIHSLRFYWSAGFVMALLGMGVYARWNRWVGLTLLIAGFTEFIYWTSPDLWGDTSREFDRLIRNKFVFSIISLLLLVVAVRLLGVFGEDRGRSG